MWTDLEHDAVVAELEGEIIALQSHVKKLGLLCAELVAAQSKLPTGKLNGPSSMKGVHNE